jgi:hypothetical protein
MAGCPEGAESYFLKKIKRTTPSVIGAPSEAK